MKKLVSLAVFVALVAICLGTNVANASTPSANEPCRCFFTTVTNVQPDSVECTRQATKYVFSVQTVRKACDGQAVGGIVKHFISVCNAEKVDKIPVSDEITYYLMTFKSKTIGVLYDDEAIVLIERERK